MIKIARTYNIATPESAEHGDFAESGYEVEPYPWRPGELRDALEQARADGIYEASSTVPHAGMWWTSIDPVQDRAFFERGEERRDSLHVDGCTASTAARITRALQGRPVIPTTSED